MFLQHLINKNKPYQVSEEVISDIDSGIDSVILYPLNEAYFGKTPDVLKMEEAIKGLRKKYSFKKGDKITNETLKPITEDKLFEKFCNAIRDGFGFLEVYGGFDPVEYMNAYTYPIREERYGYTGGRFETTATGVRFKKEIRAKAMIVATAPLFFTKKLTSAEITAIFLHEIGHSFKQTVIPIETCIDILRDSLNFVLFNFISVTKHTAAEVARHPIDALTNLSEVIRTSPEMKQRIKKRWPSIYERIWRASSNYSPSNMYIDEKFADHFAAMYGYGKELSSALVKIDYDIKNTNFPPADMFLTFSGAVDLAMQLMFDCHPVLGARLKSTVNVLQREIDKNETLPPSEKKRLKKQIEEIDMMAVQYQNLDQVTNYSLAKKLYFKFVYNNLKDGDFVSRFLVKAYNLELVDKNIEDQRVVS